MEFEPFVAMLLGQLGIEAEGPVEPSTGLFDDLGIDSFQAFQMLIVIESAADLLVPPPYLPEMFTVGDAYEYYREARRLATA